MQLQASVTGDLSDMETARTVQKVVAATPDAGVPPVAGDAVDRDLALFLGYHTDPTTQRLQARLTEGSRRVAARVGGHDSGSGGPVASVYLRITRQIAPRPSSWLVHRPMSDEKLRSMPGEFLLVWAPVMRHH